MAELLEQPVTRTFSSLDTEQFLQVRPPKIGEVRVRVSAVLPDQAALWLERYRYPQQRTLGEGRILRYLKAMQAGEWRRMELTVHHILDGTNLQWLTNGQHRLTALARHDKPAEFIIIDRYVASQQEAKLDYDAMDAPGMIRVFGDVTRSSGLAESFSLGRTRMNQILSAVTFIDANFEHKSSLWRSARGHSSNPTRIRMVGRWRGPALAAVACMRPARPPYSSVLYRQSILSVAMVTFRFQPEKADEFWGKIVANDGLRQGDPAHALHEWMVKPFYRGMGDPVHEARIVASAWNKFWVGERAQILKVSDKTQPIVIAGTPFKGKKADEAVAETATGSSA